MNNKQFKVWLRNAGACAAGREWVGKRSLEETWRELENPSWMGWLVRRTVGIEKKTFVRIACDCARLALPFVKNGEKRPLLAIEMAEKWIRGEATEAECKTAAASAASAYAADAAASAASAYAADAAASASAAAYAAASAAAYASASAYAAYAAASAYAADADAASAAASAYAADADAASAAARIKYRKMACDIFREHIKPEDLKF